MVQVTNTFKITIAIGMILAGALDTICYSAHIQCTNYRTSSSLRREDRPSIFFILSCIISSLISILFPALQRSDACRSKAKGGALSTSPMHPSRELELASLHQLPNNNNLVAENNIIYNMQSFPGNTLPLGCYH